MRCLVHCSQKGTTSRPSPCRMRVFYMVATAFAAAVMTSMTWSFLAFGAFAPASCRGAISFCTLMRFCSACAAVAKVLLLFAAAVRGRSRPAPPGLPTPRACAQHSASRVPRPRATYSQQPAWPRSRSRNRCRRWARPPRSIRRQRPAWSCRRNTPPCRRTAPAGLRSSPRA